ncbi:MAG: CoA-binding protein [Phycisphaeraceae bacterium]
MRVMVIGASTNREKFGNKAVRAYLSQGHVVLPVNPRADRIEGLRCYADAASVPGDGPIDRASMYLPPALGLEAVEQLAARGDVKELWLNPGSESPALVARAKELGLTVVQACSIAAIGIHPE